MCSVYTKEIEERRLEVLRSNLSYQYLRYRPKDSKSYYGKEKLNGYDAYINLVRTPVLLGGKLL